MAPNNLIVTHHAPDLDAIASVWLLKKFDQQNFEQAQVEFVNPGKTITETQAKKLGFQLNQVTHVDTGLGKFDHHQAERATQNICAATLVFEHVCQIHPEFKKDQALKALVKYVNQVDHFAQIHWPEADHPRYTMMIHELIRGYELSKDNNDYDQLKFGLECLDYAYQALTQTFKAKEIIEKKGQKFATRYGQGLALRTGNDNTLKQAQQQGYVLVIRKDPEKGHIRIKARPDTDFTLKKLYQEILELDHQGTWFYHHGGKMLLNGSKRDHSQKASALSLQTVLKLIKEIYG